jgi:hypothetical protein
MDAGASCWQQQQQRKPKPKQARQTAQAQQQEASTAGSNDGEEDDDDCEDGCYTTSTLPSTGTQYVTILPWMNSSKNLHQQLSLSHPQIQIVSYS